ncbi:GTP-binding protein 2 [Sphaceloma murrayae]|uniref:GTP-binding protein 2 n=1 Tax=Sphaceloma murrayae TaxID=2082308 RepID=A0A2K1R3R3_9PEZI|nr:GTP-binding protein 2 [Sphaceloma murrayae]
MASIFTFEPDIPRVSSPWVKQLDSLHGKANSKPGSPLSLNDRPAVSKLESEPQDGPVEYKLHLLLRPRRSYSKSSRNAGLASGPKTRSALPKSREHADANLAVGHIPSGPLTHQARQHRLEQLTTQLLWRLQQSCSNHASSATNVILPHLPDASAELKPLSKPAKLIHGLEESQGALYEIGVADDGTFIGLSEDEMQESIHNLRAMASCLGCAVEVLRTVPVGHAEWLEEDDAEGSIASTTRHSKLVVAEALVKPIFTSDNSEMDETDPESQAVGLAGPGVHSITHTPERDSSNADRQIRVSLTGGTSSGKSSLLGTLTTSALDNARGKSRLSTLKHRHEIDSGLTSSVSQELLGYREVSDETVEVVNYAGDGIHSWVDIHSRAAGGRLVLLSDSAGHPRYRRTAVKGLVGWAPHWTLLCVSGNELEGPSLSSTPDQTASADMSSDADLSTAYLDLCLRLDLPLVVIITKLDTSSKNTLRSTLGNLLTLLKDAGRRPAILPSAPASSFESDTQTLTPTSIAQAAKFVDNPDFDPYLTVPIVMTSAVQGTGIETLHALLYSLPIPHSSPPPDSPGPTFHVEDIYTIPFSPSTTIVAGLLRNASISVGDELYLGPFSRETEDSDSDNSARRRPSSGGHSKSFPGAIRTVHRHVEEWRRVKITSIRNLRLPVKALSAEQVGTLAFETVSSPTIGARLGIHHSGENNAPLVANQTGQQDERATSTSVSKDTCIPRLPTSTATRARKGMLLLSGPGTAASSVTARFKRDDLGALAVGSQVVLYIASVRTSARVLAACVPETVDTTFSAPTLLDPGAVAAGSRVGADPEATSSLQASISSLASLRLDDGEGEAVAGKVTHEDLLVTFAFEGRECVSRGARVLVMPGGGPGIFGGQGERGAAALEGFVGVVIDFH